MNRDQSAGTGGENDNLSYNERGADNMDDLTRSDENMMDRTAQSGTTGAFGQGGGTDREQRRQDAEEAFGGSNGSIGKQEDAGGGSSSGS